MNFSSSLPQLSQCFSQLLLGCFLFLCAAFIFIYSIKTSRKYLKIEKKLLKIFYSFHSRLCANNFLIFFTPVLKKKREGFVFILIFYYSLRGYMKAITLNRKHLWFFYIYILLHLRFFYFYFVLLKFWRRLAVRKRTLLKCKMRVNVNSNNACIINFSDTVLVFHSHSQILNALINEKMRFYC